MVQIVKNPYFLRFTEIICYSIRVFALLFGIADGACNFFIIRCVYQSP